MKNKQSGFTLLEILLVIGIIAILAAIVIIALNPGKSLAKTRDLQRKVGINEISKALTQYYIDNGQYPASLDSNSIKSICPTGSGTNSSGVDCMGMVDLSALVPAYLPSIPVDPTDASIGYKVGVSHSHRRVMLIAPLTETSSNPISIGTTTSPLDTSPTITVGDGSINNPYQISNWSQLNQVRDDLNANYILMASLSASTLGYSGIGNNWTPIGDGNVTDFSGSFNGDGNTISDLTVDLTTNLLEADRNFAGLFGAVVNGSISNLRLLDVDIAGYKWVGGLVGYLQRGTVTNCASGGVIHGGYAVGGLVGRNYGGAVSHSFSSANIVGTVFNVQATTYLGGLVGDNYGYTTPTSQISNSYSTGSVTAYSSSKNGIGGFSNNSGSNASITNSYSTGNVSGSLGAGGLLAYNGGGTVTNSYWDKETSGQTTSAGGVGTTTDIMKTASFYSTWDTNIWSIFDGDYPTLK